MTDAQQKALAYALALMESAYKVAAPQGAIAINRHMVALAALSSAPPDPRPVTDASPAVGVDGYDGEGVLAWWPIMTLDDDGNLTDTISEGRWLVTFRYGDGSWFEPAEMEADWCDDEQQYGEAPLFWLRLPPDPVPTSEGGGKQYPGVAASAEAPAPPDKPYCRECGSESLAYVEQYANGADWKCRDCGTIALQPSPAPPVAETPMRKCSICGECPTGDGPVVFPAPVEPDCTGPFTDAFDCPRCDPRRGGAR